ncbi:MAG TPA: PQQ-dependent sugar dehydrogenase [Ilumatobacteraceae bacterium]
MRGARAVLLIGVAAMLSSMLTSCGADDAGVDAMGARSAVAPAGGATQPAQPSETSVAGGADSATTVAPAESPPTTAPPPTPVPPTTVPPTPATAPPTTAVPPDPLPAIAQIEQAAVAIQPVLDLDIPVAIAFRPGDPGPYVIGQAGYVWRIDEAGAATLVLDFSARVTPFADGSERGLLGIAFGPDDRMFLNFTDLSNDTNVVSMAMAGIAPVPETEWPVLYVEQPGLGHNGGTLAFDRAGNLYVAMGDGGGSNGLDAQDPAKLLGTILRIRPKADGPGYDIPPDNPFVGHPEIRPEKYAYGFRNPWRFSIDDETGDIWLGDVGNESWEEIDRIPAGQAGTNYGWYWYEGSHERRGGAPPDIVPPVWDYSHDVGVAVIGGVVYRGAAIPALRGAYLFGDITGILWAVGVDGVHRLPIDLRGVAAFAEGPDGEIWMASIWGKVARLVPG